MKKNYRLEILSFLEEQEAEPVNIRPLINSITAEGHHTFKYLGIMLQGMRTNHLLWYDEAQIIVTDANKPIMARIEPQGITELKYLKLKNKAVTK